MTERGGPGARCWPAGYYEPTPPLTRLVVTGSGPHNRQKLLLKMSLSLDLMLESGCGEEVITISHTVANSI